MDEMIEIINALSSGEYHAHQGEFYEFPAIKLCPVPEQRVPILVGGHSTMALERAGRLGDGWMGSAIVDDDTIVASLDRIRSEAEAVGRDPAEIELQMMLQPPPTSEDDKAYYADHDRVVRRAVRLHELGFEWISLNATAVFQAGARSVDAMVDQLGRLHAATTAEID